MRTYGFITTMMVVAMLMPHVLWFTKMDLIEIMFVTGLVMLFAGLIYGFITEPRKKKSARWEKAGNLEVMIQHSNNMSR